MSQFQLIDCTDTLLHEIENKALKRRDIAQTYRLAMESSEKTDWGKVNRAIMARFKGIA